jgi:hypothetical protein
MLLCDHGRGPTCSTMAREGKRSNVLYAPKNLSFFSPTFLRHKEEDEKAMTDGARGRKGPQGRLFTFIALWCHNRGVKEMSPYKA